MAREILDLVVDGPECDNIWQAYHIEPDNASQTDEEEMEANLLGEQWFLSAEFVTSYFTCAINVFYTTCPACKLSLCNFEDFLDRLLIKSLGTAWRRDKTETCLATGLL